MKGFNGLSFQNRHAFTEAVTGVLNKVNGMISEDPEHSMDQIEDFLKQEDAKLDELVQSVGDWINDTEGAASALGELLILDHMLMDLRDEVYVSEYVADVKDSIRAVRSGMRAEEGGDEFFIGVQEILHNHLENSHDFIGQKWKALSDQIHPQAEGDDAEITEDEPQESKTAGMSMYNAAYVEGNEL